MAVINFARREIITRIVYFGAPGAGTTSNVRYLYAHGRWKTNGPLLPFGPEEGEQTHFFELVPEDVDLPGFSMRVRLYSLPGGLADRAHREEVLRDADAIVLVADARPGRNEGNIDALLDLDRLLKDLDVELSTLPMVFQVNHTDHEHAEDVREVVYDLNPYGHPTIPARASEGIGVEETLSRVMDGILQSVRDNLAGQPTSLHVHAIHRREDTAAEAVLEAHLRAIALARAEAGEQTEERARPWTRSNYDILPTGPAVEVPYQPPELIGMRPVHILDTRLDREHVHVDLVLDDSEAGHPTRLRVTLVPPSRVMSTPTAVNPGTPHTDGTVPAVPTREEVTKSLPDKIEIVSRAPDSKGWVWYGVAGAAAGIVAGLLLGFLIWG